MKGIYVLLIRVTENISLSIGALGIESFQRGLYAYVGSAQISLEKRLERHFSKTKGVFWHVDYLLKHREAEVVGAFWKGAERAEECRVAKRLGKIAMPVTGFGSSDCSCSSHLFRVEVYGHLKRLMHEIGMKPFRWRCRW